MLFKIVWSLISWNRVFENKFISLSMGNLTINKGTIHKTIQTSNNNAGLSRYISIYNSNSVQQKLNIHILCQALKRYIKYMMSATAVSHRKCMSV